MRSQIQDWDFFIAHAGADVDAAEKLHDHLRQNFKVFLDSRCLLPGDDWDTALPEAQKRSRVSIILISARTSSAYYQREEVASAISMARKDQEAHRVVPVFLHDAGFDRDSVPYGLRLKHSISVNASCGLDEVARILVKNLAPTLAMSEQQIAARHNERAILEYGLRLIPTAGFSEEDYLGKCDRQYVIVGDYYEQRYRTLEQILSNLLMGDWFERLQNSDVEWTAIVFKVGRYNYSKLDLLPATWKAAFRILSDHRRMACFSPTEAEKEKMRAHKIGGLRDYMSEDQQYWYERLTAKAQREDQNAGDYLMHAKLGIDTSCYSGMGLTLGTIPSRIFFVKNVQLKFLEQKIIPMGFPSGNTVLL